jgi:hypothetical protein
VQVKKLTLFILFFVMVFLYSSLALGLPVEYFETINDLKAITPSQNMAAIVGRYDLSNDDGGGQFFWDPNSIELDNGGTILIPNNNPPSGRWIRVAKDNFNVTWFGANGKDILNDAPAIQLAINAAQNKGGGVIYFPPGDYRLESTLRITGNNIQLRGAGTTTTVLTRMTDYGDTIIIEPIEDVNQYNTYIFNIGIFDLRIYAGVELNSGAHIKMTRAYHSHISNIQLSNGFKGLELISCVASTFDNLDLDTDTFFPPSLLKEGSSLIKISREASHPDSKNCSELFFSNINARGNFKNPSEARLEDVVVINSGDGLWFDNCHLAFARNSACKVIREHVDDQINGLEFNNCWFDACNYGVIYGNSDGYGYLGCDTFSGCLFVDQGMDGCLLEEPDRQGVTFSGCSFGCAQDHGCHIKGGNNFTLSGCRFFDNNKRNGVSGSGLFIEGSSLNITISGCTFSNEEESSQNRGYQKGIYAGGEADIIVVSGCSFKNMIADDIVISSNVKDIKVESIISDKEIKVINADGYGTLYPEIGYNTFLVNGPNPIGLIASDVSKKGRRITLIFNSSVTVYNSNNLKIYGTFNAQAGYTIALVSDGTYWYEVSRSTNY